MIAVAVSLAGLLVAAGLILQWLGRAIDNAVRWSS